MLNELEVINFQSHLHSYLEFVKGINIIRGTSNHGKSALVRAMTWAFENEPRGADFRNWDKEAKDGVEVHMGFDTGTISRINNNQFNGYVINGSEELSALRSDVPEEVRAISHVTKSNILGQDDGYFLLRETPGNIARKLNERAGLEDIDRVQKETKSLIDHYTSELNRARLDLEKKKEEVKFLSSFKAHEKTIRDIDNLFTKQDETERRCEAIANSIETITAITESINSCEKILESQEAVAEISKLLERRLAIAARHTRLRLTLENIESIDLHISEIRESLEYEPLVKEILELGDQRTKFIKKYNTLFNVVDSIEKLNKAIKTKKNEILKLKNTADKLQSEVGDICPNCGAHREHWNIDIRKI